LAWADEERGNWEIETEEKDGKVVDSALQGKKKVLEENNRHVDCIEEGAKGNEERG